MQYRREIDGLRAVAVLPVILFHAGFGLFKGGFVGVDVFFVISGYLITGLLIEELERGDFSIVRFYERRARRILPALFVVMLACIPFAWMWMLPSEFKDFSQSLVAVVFFVSNILFWRESGYFAPDAELKPLLHTWSLAVEEQYYLLFPLFLLLLWRFGRSRVLLVTIVMAAMSLALSEWGMRHLSAAANFYLTLTRAWELLAGAICAFLTTGRVQRRNDPLAALGLALILGAVFTFDEATPFPGLHALVPVAGAALIVVYGGAGTWTARFLSLRPFVGIGLISYSAYLWHQPIFAFTRIRSPTEPSPWLMAGLTLVALVLAWTTWRFVEQPFRRRVHRALPARRSTFAASAAAGAAFLAFGLSGHVGNGFESRFQPNTDLIGDVGHLEFHRRLDQRYVDCEPASVAATALSWEGFLRCKQTRPGFADVVLLGDSHAEHLFLGLAEALPQRNVVFYIQNGIPFLTNEVFGAIFDELLSSERPRTVLISMHYTRFDLPEADRLAFESNLVKTVQRLQSTGSVVVLVGDVPRFYTRPDRCVIMNLSDQCTMDYGTFLHKISSYDEMLGRVSYSTHTLYIPVSNQICNEKICSIFDGNMLLYRDNNHLNLLGSERVGRYVASCLFDAMSNAKSCG